MSTAEWESAGLYDPAAPAAEERLALLEFLDKQSFSVDEMRAANDHGRLFALAGDRTLRGGVAAMSLVDIAALVERDVEIVSAVWHAVGLENVTSNDAVVATEGDVGAVRTALVLVDLLGADSALRLLRGYGLAMERVADAASAAFRPVSDVSVRRSGSELTTAKTWLELTQFVGEIGRLLDVAHRHRVDASRRFFEAAGTETELSDRDREVRLAIAFIDLSGFTALSQILPADELAQLLEAFEKTTHDIASHHGCRVVKFIGDAAMVVSPDLPSLARMAVSVVQSFREPTAARAGLAFGELVAREGDYFGRPVNLAARLIAAASPASVVTTPGVAAELPGEWHSKAIGSHEFRGFDDAVAVVEITLADA